MFTVDCESGIGAKRVSNYEVADFAAQHSDICIPFASIDPHKGKLGAREGFITATPVGRGASAFFDARPGSSDVTLVGAVLTKFDLNKADYGYDYHYNYSYGAASDDAPLQRQSA